MADSKAIGLQSQTESFFAERWMFASWKHITEDFRDSQADPDFQPFSFRAFPENFSFALTGFGGDAFRRAHSPKDMCFLSLRRFVSSSTHTSIRPPYSSTDRFKGVNPTVFQLFKVGDTHLGVLSIGRAPAATQHRPPEGGTEATPQRETPLHLAALRSPV